MEGIRAGERLLSLLAPSGHLFWRTQRAAQVAAAAAASEHCRLRPGHRALQCPPNSRSFSTSRSCSAEQPLEAQTPLGRRRPSDTKFVDFDAALSNIDADGARRRAAATATRPAGSGSPGAPGRGYVDDLLSALVRPDGNTANRTAMLGPDVTRHLSGALTEPPPLKPFERKLGPSVGRTIAISERNNVDVARAFRMLDMSCNRNRVKQDFQSQRFHERPGIKRKRLYMERWRKRFRREFDATVQLVQKMRKQGW